MKTFQQFREELIKEGYKFIRTSKKPFGQRIVGHKSTHMRTEKRVLIYRHTRKVPNLEDFSNFLGDFERFIEIHEVNYDVKAGFFLVGEKCPKKVVQGLRTVLKHSSEDLRKRVKIIQLKT